MKMRLFLVLGLVVLAGCSKPSPLHEAMEEMGSSFKVMREATNFETIKQEFPEFQAALEVASAQKVKPEHQATFDEGMDELEPLVAQLETALAADNALAAEQLLQKIGDVRKEYHEELEVEKD